MVKIYVKYMNKLEEPQLDMMMFVLPRGSYYYNLDEYIIKYALDNDKPQHPEYIMDDNSCKIFNYFVKMCK